MKNIKPVTAARLMVELFGSRRIASDIVKDAENIIACDDNLRHKYDAQRRNAAHRKIKFLLTYDQWLQIWINSGHLPKRGKGEGLYVMARHGDKGPYSVDNVSIILHADNVREGRLGKKTSKRDR